MIHCKLLLVPSDMPTRRSESVPGVLRLVLFTPIVMTIVARGSTSPSGTFRRTSLAVPGPMRMTLPWILAVGLRNVAK